MAEKSGFFNALMVDGAYDRKYNADDYSDNLAVVISNGVLRSINDDLKVTASGMVATVAAGRGWINGHYYYNDTAKAFAAVTPPSGGTRYDRIMLRFDNTVSNRKIYLVYVQGTAGNNPQKPAPTRTATVYDLVLADIFVGTNATSLVVTDTRGDASLCGWVYSVSGDGSFFTSLENSFSEWFEAKKDTLASVTLFKKYTWTGTMSAAGRNIAFDIPQYDPETCFIEVYVNGVYERRYNIAGEVLTFEGTLIAGTVVTVNAYKSIDGTDIMTVAEEITELQQAVATLDGVSKYTYKCRELDDNVALSDIAQAFYAGSYNPQSVNTGAAQWLEAIGGNTYLAGLDDDAQIMIDVVGYCDVTTPHSGAGTPTSRYRWFSLGTANKEKRKITFNFGKCENISFACPANTDNIVFYGTDENVQNANVKVTAAGSGCDITMFVGNNSISSGRKVENSRLSVETTGDACIANGGEFYGCDCLVKSSGGNACCFDASNNSLVRLFGGNYWAYAATSSMKATVLNTESGFTNAAIMANNINCPTEAVSGYVQKHFANGSAGVINVNGVVTTLTSIGSGVTVTNKIAMNKL